MQCQAALAHKWLSVSINTTHNFLLTLTLSVSIVLMTRKVKNCSVINKSRNSRSVAKTFFHFQVTCLFHKKSKTPPSFRIRELEFIIADIQVFDI